MAACKFRIPKSMKTLQKEPETMTEACLLLERGLKRKRPISVCSKDQLPSPTGFCIPNIKFTNIMQEGVVLKKYKVRDCLSPESTNSTINHSLKTIVNKSDRSNSLFRDKGNYGQVVSRPKCKHIIITARSNTNQLDRVEVPYEAKANMATNKRPTTKSVDKDFDIQPLTSRLHYQGTMRELNIETAAIKIKNTGNKKSILPNISYSPITSIKEQDKPQVPITRKRLLSDDVIGQNIIKPIKCSYIQRGRSKPKNYIKIGNA